MLLGSNAYLAACIFLYLSLYFSSLSRLCFSSSVSFFFSSLASCCYLPVARTFSRFILVSSSISWSQSVSLTFFFAGLTRKSYDFFWDIPSSSSYCYFILLRASNFYCFSVCCFITSTLNLLTSLREMCLNWLVAIQLNLLICPGPFGLASCAYLAKSLKYFEASGVLYVLIFYLILKSNFN